MLGKKFIALLLSVASVFSLAFATGCELKFDGNKGEIKSELTKLSAPMNVRVENGIIRWSAVSNADSYVVQVGDETHQAVTAYLEYPLSSLFSESASGLYVKVKAMPSSSILYSESDWSQLYGPFDYTKNTVAQVQDGSGNKNEIKKLECFSYPNENMTKKYTMFKDDNYYYYVFYLGRIYNVALENGSKDYYQGIGERTLSFTTTKSTVESIRQESKEVTEESSRRDYSLAENFKYSRSENLGLGVKEGEVSASAGVGNSLEIGLSATQSWGFNNAKTISTTYETSAQKTEETQQNITYKFDQSCPAGNYLYTLIGDLDVYTLVLVDPAENVKGFEIYNYSSIVTSNRMMIYIGDEPEYKNRPDNVLEFKMSDVEACFDKIPTADISEYYAQAQDYILKATPKSCDQDNGFNPNNPDSGDDAARHNGFDLGELIVGGTIKSGNKYILRPGEKFRMSFHLLQDPFALPISSAENTADSKEIQNDDYSGKVYGLGLNGETIGYGACYVKCVYTDNTDNSGNPYYITNFFKDKNKGDYLSINVPIDTEKTLRSITVTIVYEIMTKGNSFFNWWTEYSNWRCEYNINF